MPPLPIQPNAADNTAQPPGLKGERPMERPNLGEVLVRVEGVSKKFCRNLKKSLAYGVRDVLAELNPFGGSGQTSAGSDEAGPELRPGEFWANKDISFELRRGECLGIIGHNGAGKTTLLKMLNGLIKPDEGRIEMRGRVGALIALGAGFNPILTGRENIYVNGSILGLKKREIDAKIEEIIEFSGIREFIDSPVQSYSSGMQVRLGFSVAVNLLRPDVLILDEVLAVGDMAFRIKCLNKVAEISANCATIFISHEALQISRICHRVIWLKKGRLIEDTTEVDKILAEYSAQILPAAGQVVQDLMGSGQIASLRINDTSVETRHQAPVDVDATRPLEISFELSGVNADKNTLIQLQFLDEAGKGVAEVRTSTLAERPVAPAFSKNHSLKVLVKLPGLPLADAIYSLRLSLSENKSYTWILYMPTIATLKLTGHGRSWGKALLEGEWEFATRGPRPGSPP